MPYWIILHSVQYGIINVMESKKQNIIGKMRNELNVFRSYPKNMRILLITNMLYAFVLPVVELFVGTYIIRNSSEISYVVGYQLAVYTGIPLTFLINGFLMRKIRIKHLYAFGMLLSGISMAVMMSLGSLKLGGVIAAGLIMGMSYGFFWANRDFLALHSTDDCNRNYYYGLESFFNTIAGVLIPYVIGVFLGSVDNGFLGNNISLAYKIVTACVFIITICASAVLYRGDFAQPKRERFLFFRFISIWKKLMGLAGLKGIAQGFIVTAPSMLVMTFIGNESTLGTLQSISAIISAILLYLLGRFTSPKHRIWIFAAGLTLFAAGGAFNAALYSATGVVVFMLCLVLGRPLMDMGYFPIQMRVIDYVAKTEGRSSYTYIFIHELGLYLGRFFGCGLFILLTVLISDTVALRYTILIIGLIQLMSIPVANGINRTLDKLEN